VVSSFGNVYTLWKKSAYLANSCNSCNLILELAHWDWIQRTLLQLKNIFIRRLLLVVINYGRFDFEIDLRGNNPVFGQHFLYFSFAKLLSK
jgi:hypothetical protein